MPVAGSAPGTWWRQIEPSLLSSGGVATGRRLGRRRFPGRKQFIWGTRSSWRGGQHGLLVSKAKQEVRKDWPVPKPASRAAFCPRLWLHQPLTFSEKTWAPFSFPSGAAFSQGHSLNCRLRLLLRALTEATTCPRWRREGIGILLEEWGQTSPHLRSENPLVKLWNGGSCPRNVSPLTERHRPHLTHALEDTWASFSQGPCLLSLCVSLGAGD